MAAKPTKMIQVTAPPAADTSRLPVTRGSDQRAPGLQGTLGPFVTGGVQGAGLPLYVIADPGGDVTLTPDQCIGAVLAWGPVAAGNQNVSFPSAAQIVSYIGSDLTRVRPGATPTNGDALTPSPITAGPQIYEAYDLYMTFFDANSTYQIGFRNWAGDPLAQGTYCYGATLTGAASGVGVPANTYTFLHFKVIIANSAPGSELVWIILVAK